MVTDRFQVEVLGGTGQRHDVIVDIEARVDKASEAPVVALGESVNITIAMLDAGELAWLTGMAAKRYLHSVATDNGRNIWLEIWDTIWTSAVKTKFVETFNNIVICLNIDVKNITLQIKKNIKNMFL